MCRREKATSSDGEIRWRLIVDEDPRSGPRNMALDHALAECSRAGEGVLRFYRWSPHTVSFGRNEPTKGKYDLARARDEGLGFVRRPTGGRAVLHAEEVTYSVVAPVHTFGGPRPAYRRIGEGLVAGLAELGCPASVATSGSALPPDAGPCFQVPAPGEVILRGRKLVGSAQVRLGEALLQHGSIILAGDQSGLARLTGGGEDPFPPATLESVVGSVAWRDVVGALSRGMALAFGGEWSNGGATPSEVSRSVGLEEDHYAADHWTWRR